MKLLAIGITFLQAFLSIEAMRCYVCSSYMEQCKTYVHTSKAYAHRGRCYSKCFTRLGEDGAIYRGCFDGFREVPFLTSNYDGCQNQTWNGQSLPWCFCKGDLCNGVSMNDMGYDVNIDLTEGYRVPGHRTSRNQFISEKDTVKQDTGYEEDSNQFAKEGMNSDNGFGIKDSASAVSQQSETAVNNKYTDYFSQNGFLQSYYNPVDYDQFHYSYQVEDPNAYIEDTDPAKYIAMDESEGFKVNIDVGVDASSESQENKVVTKKKKVPTATLR